MVTIGFIANNAMWSKPSKSDNARRTRGVAGCNILFFANITLSAFSYPHERDGKKLIRLELATNHIIINY